MVHRIPRVTNGHRAAVCGLMIAGVNFTDACKIADVSRDAIKEYLPPNWRKRATTRTNRSFKGETLEALRLAYADRNLTGRDIAARFGIDSAYLYRLAIIHDWPRRCHKHALPPMTREQRRLYQKFRRSEMPRMTAIAEAMR